MKSPAHDGADAGRVPSLVLERQQGPKKARKNTGQDLLTEFLASLRKAEENKEGRHQKRMALLKRYVEAFEATKK